MFSSRSNPRFSAKALQKHRSKMDERRKTLSRSRRFSLVFVFTPSSLSLSLSLSLSSSCFSISVSLMKPLNTSPKRTSFLGRSHFHLSSPGELVPRTRPRFFAGLKAIAPAKRFIAETTRPGDLTLARCPLPLPGKLYYPSQLRENCTVNSGRIKKNN